MNLIIFGPPGAGKGTQSNFIVKKYKLFQLSTGEILRNEIKNQTDLGIKISSTMNSGSLVSDEIINKVAERVGEIRNHRSQACIIPHVALASHCANAKEFVFALRDCIGQWLAM